MALSVEEIRAIGQGFRVAQNASDGLAESLRSLATALGWNDRPASVDELPISIGDFTVRKAYIGPQPAVIFSSVSNGALGSGTAALFAYHSSIDWGLLASSNGLVIFNSHWIKNENWFHLPTLPWENLEANIELLEHLTPKGIAEEQIDRFASKIGKPDRFLRRVDEALVTRLDHWRSITITHSNETNKVDEALQTLFAQLFILRAVEDRQLAQDLPNLRSVCGPTGEVDITALNNLLTQARHTIGGELYEVETISVVPEEVLGGIINDLYVPHDLPDNSVYNFAWIDADVLGLAYEKYLSTIFTPTALPPQVSLFEQPKRAVEAISVRKAGGVYYTPPYIVQFLTEKCLDALPDDVNTEHIPRIADFACGSGSFLVAAANALIVRLRHLAPERNWTRELVEGKFILGIDVDERAVTITRLHLWLRFTEEPNPLPLPRLAEIIIHGDSLAQATWENIQSEFDIILGNPPFLLASGLSVDKGDLERRFKTAQGRYDYSYLFVELAINRLVISGVLGMVVPNRLFRNRDAAALREIITSQTDLKLVVDFGSNEVFEKTSAYVGAIVAQRIDPQLEVRSEVMRAIRVKSVDSEFLGATLINKSSLGEEVTTDDVQAYDVPIPQGTAPWLLVSPSMRRIRSVLENDSEQLETIAGVFQGIRTGANDIFIARLESQDGSIAKVLNGLGEYGFIEVALLRSAVFGSDIQRYELVNSNRFLVFPYIENRVIPEDELQEKYPKTYEYLLRYRDILSSRVSIAGSGALWYELVRRRDETWLSRPKLVIRDLAAETSFAVDYLGGEDLIGGTAVAPADPDLLLPLLAYLNSNLVNEYLRQITPEFRGGFQKFEPQHLNRIPVIRRLIEDVEFARTLEAEAWRVINAVSKGHETERLEAEATIEASLNQVLDG